MIEKGPKKVSALGPMTKRMGRAMIFPLAWRTSVCCSAVCISVGEMLLIRLIPTDPPPRIIVDPFPWLSGRHIGQHNGLPIGQYVDKYWQVSREYLVSSTLQVLGGFFMQSVSKYFPVFPIYSISSTSVYLHIPENDVKALNHVIQNTGTPEQIHFYHFSSTLPIISNSDSIPPICLLLF